MEMTYYSMEWLTSRLSVCYNINIIHINILLYKYYNYLCCHKFCYYVVFPKLPDSVLLVIPGNGNILYSGSFPEINSVEPK